MAEYERTVPFKNWTTEDFQGRFGIAVQSPTNSGDQNHSAELILDEPSIFKVGATYAVPQSVAIHFARQLAIRELHKLGTTRGDMLMQNDVDEYMARCFEGKLNESPLTKGYARLDETEETPEVLTAKPETAPSVEDEDGEHDREDIKATPVFKKGPGRPRKDEQYT
jgi:hypothetical protein